MQLHKIALIAEPVRKKHDFWITILSLAVVAGVASAVIYFNWATAKSVNSALAGFFPLWDASAYYQCSNALIDVGQFHGGLCGRRPIYPSLLASLMMVGGRNLHAVLLLQGLLLSALMVVLAREFARMAGPLGAVVAIVLLGAFASRYAFGNVMTENAGLGLGCIALVLLLRGAETSASRVFYCGIAVLSIAINARAGAFFVLPAAVAWACYDARRRGLGIFKAAFFASCAASAGFLFLFALLAMNGDSPREAHSNLSWYLYGFAVGGKGWAQAQIDHPNLSPTELYRVILQLVVEQPSLMFGALARNLLDVLKNGVGLYGGYLRGLEIPFWSLWLVGLAGIGARFRDPRCALIGFLEAGNIISGPFISQTDGARVYAATLPIDVAVVVIGLRFVFDLAFQRMRPSRPALTTTPRPIPRMAITLAAVLIAAIIAPYTPLRSAAALARLDGPRCADGDRTLITQLGRESVALVVVENDAARATPPRAPLKVLLAWRAHEPAIVDSLTQARPPYSFMLAYQRAIFDKDFGRVFPMTWPGDLSAFYGQVVQICFRDADRVRNDLLWGTSYTPRSISPIAKPR